MGFSIFLWGGGWDALLRLFYIYAERQYFTAISAFCNAGIDLLGDVSLSAYATNPIVGAVTMALIVLGGLGFVVWWDVLRVAKFIGKRKRPLSSLTLQSKIALTSTAVLLALG